jgi:hypothetical protein
MLKMKNFAWILTSALVLLLSTNVFANGSIELLIPVQQDLEGIRPDGEPRTAEGQELFGLINGGAVTFLKYNFQNAIFQDFLMDSGKTINLEIYNMDARGNSKGIYMEKKGAGGEKLALDAEGLMAGYYCVFWKGPYYITITGEDDSNAVQEGLTAIAGYLIQGIKQAVIPP